MHCNPGMTHEKCHIGKQMVRVRTQIFIAQSSCRVAAAVYAALLQHPFYSSK